MPGAARVLSEYQDLLARTETLIREFQPSLSAGTVITTVVSCRNQLRRAGVRRGLAIAAEAMARARLQVRLAEPDERSVDSECPSGRASSTLPVVGTVRRRKVTGEARIPDTGSRAGSRSAPAPGANDCPDTHPPHTRVRPLPTQDTTRRARSTLPASLRERSSHVPR